MTVNNNHNIWLLKIILAVIFTITISASLVISTSAVITNDVGIEGLYQIMNYGTGAEDFKYLYYPAAEGQISGYTELLYAQIPTYVGNNLAFHYNIAAGRFSNSTITSNYYRLVSIKIPIFTETRSIIQVAIPHMDGTGTYNNNYWVSDYDEIYTRPSDVPTSILKTFDNNSVIASNVEFGVYTDLDLTGYVKSYNYDIIQLVVDPGDVLNLYIYHDGPTNISPSEIGVILLGIQFLDTAAADKLTDISLILNQIKNNTGSLNTKVDTVVNDLHTMVVPSQEALDYIASIKQNQAEQKDKLDKIMDALASPDKPTPDDLDIGGFYDELNVGSDPGITVISEILNTSIIIQPLTIVLSLALISFILFGKKT